MLSDIEIANLTELEPISSIAEGLGISGEDIELYGKYKAKITRPLQGKKRGKLVLVTAMNPTPAGEGKTTISIGLAQALHKKGKNAVLALREPSLGPVFGIKGGAAGGGYSQVLPMEDLNLHFTGDIHAITSANNLLSAMLDNHLFQGNELKIDKNRILWKRCMDMNDRALRQIDIGLRGRLNGVPRQDIFSITAASEIMAILCLSKDLEDLKERIARIVVAYNEDGEPVHAGQLQAQGAMAVLLKDAIKPNLIQTGEHTPAIIHGGPFANIAHGCNSIIATKLAMELGDIVVTEAGFGADLGAEKFLNITSRAGDFWPDAVVLVATVRSLKYNGGIPREELSTENLDAIKNGFGNLQKHIENMHSFGIPCVVAANRFPSDTDAELSFLSSLCAKAGATFAPAEIYAKGGNGGLELADRVLAFLSNSEEEKKPAYTYALTDSIEDKIRAVAKKIYGAAEVDFLPAALQKMEDFTKEGYGEIPICIAKTQYSLSDDPKKLGRPQDFTLTVRDVWLSAGAGYLVILTGTIMTMPGLPKEPAAEKIDIEKSGLIRGLF